ncbi:hypothetical protein [Shouchella tritolerans]|uniref:hypothetical protein n=1 Tax=Shouchella tritolerans TaxID=2979466 RepID=UPI0021E7F875|nr:hypothetical protein [Shouchella tritolerans]
MSDSLRGSSDRSTTTIYPDLQDYIIRNQRGEDATVEELVKENKQYHEEYKN